MLTPNVIPDKEPILNVGIVLPEDQFTEIRIEIPSTPEYQLTDVKNDILNLKNCDVLKFGITEKVISVIINDKPVSGSKSWTIKLLEPYAVMANKSGLKVNGVVAGRGFHWVKNIDVYLPGSVELRIVDGVLLAVNILPIEQYLMCVATSEMGAECPPALTESQTIVARSWMLANIEMKHRNLQLDVCNDDCCQRYQGTTYLNDEAVRGALNTYGKVLIADDKICDARYFKSCGGITESFENVFGDEPISYLQPVVDAPDSFSHEALPLDSEEAVRQWIDDVPDTFCSPHTIPKNEMIKYLGSVDVEGEYFRWNFRYTQKEITALLNLKLDLNARAIIAINPLQRGYSGRLIRSEIEYQTKDGEQRSIEIKDQYVIRQTLHELFLYSSAFIVNVEDGEGGIPLAFNLKGAGWGHGVGYCQIGALGMALKGYSTKAIVLHYYPGSQLKKIY
ncbi:SpoIID/LytB domain-containing protein [bacterium]|nr:SpoIID/LytB domain-containing protein [bacterium]MBU1633619.1 SpoIID/LytB domain-containing protein [bacterium]MBU1872340.1 SpoIID/LytB domain-containing protein [bacterium]